MSTDTDLKAYTVGDYLSSQSTIFTVDEGARTSYLENRIVGVNDDDLPTTCLSDPESMCQTMFPLSTKVCGLTTYLGP